jgi:cytochrome c oxidase assembly factor CtaG
MNQVQKAVLLSWDLRPEVIIILVAAGVLYTRGWSHLRALRKQPRVSKGSPVQAERGRLATAERLTAYLSGLVVLGLALMSPIDILGGQFFFMHMIQHLLLVMIVPPLLWLASPLPFAMWGLPVRARRKVGELLRPRSAFRRRLRALTPPGIVWILFVSALLGWHDPGAYQAALQDELVHDLEHLSFFVTAMLFWWHVIDAAPNVHKRLTRGARIAYVLSVVPVNMAAGVVIAFSGEPIYSYYIGVPRLWGMTVLQDQMLGGILMWIPGSMMYIIAALALISRWLQDEEQKPPLPHTEWATEEAMVAPGLENKTG